MKNIRIISLLQQCNASFVLLFITIVSVGLSSCGDADTITTPRSVETTPKRYSIIDSIDITPQTVTVNAVLNGKAIVLTLSPQATGIRAIQFADSTWGIDGKALLISSPIIPDTLMLQLDTLNFRTSALRTDDALRNLEASITSAKNNASLCVFHTNKSVAINTTDTAKTDSTIRRANMSDLCPYEDVIITYRHNNGKVTVDTVREPHTAFSVGEPGVGKVITKRIITIHTGNDVIKTPAIIQPGYYNGQFVAPILGLKQQGTSLTATLTFSSQGLAALETTLGSAAQLQITLSFLLP